MKPQTKKPSPVYVLGLLDQGGRISLGGRRTRVHMTVTVPGLAEQIRDVYGGTVSGSRWMLSGGRKVEAFLRKWAEHTLRDDVHEALAEMDEQPHREAELDYILTCVEQGDDSFRALAARIPRMSEYRLRAALHQLVHDERLFRSPSRVLEDGGTSGYTYYLPGSGLSIDL